MESYAIGSVGIAGGGVGFNPSVNVFDHPPSCASLPVLGSEITPTDLFWCFIGACDCISVYQLQLVCTVIIQLQYHISIIKLSRSVIVHTCTVTVLLCYWNGNKIAVLLYYMCTVYSTDFMRHTVLPLIRFGVVYCSLANALPHFRL